MAWFITQYTAQVIMEVNFESKHQTTDISSPPSMFWKALQAEFSILQYPVMTGKPHGGLQCWLKLLPVWSSDQSSEAEVLLASDQWNTAHWRRTWCVLVGGSLLLSSSHFSYPFQMISSDTDMHSFVSCRWAKGETSWFCVWDEQPTSRIHKDGAARQAGGFDPVPSEWVEGCYRPSRCPLWCPRWVQCRMVSNSQVQHVKSSA